MIKKVDGIGISLRRQLLKRIEPLSVIGFLISTSGRTRISLVDPNFVVTSRRLFLDVHLLVGPVDLGLA